MPWDPFRSKMITDITIVNDYFVCIDFHTALGFTVTFVFLYLSRRSAVITMTLLLLVSWGQGVDGSWDGFSESQVRRIHSPFEPVFMPVSAKVVALFTQRDIGQESSGKGSNFITNDAFLLLKYDRNFFLQWEKRKFSHVERQGVWVHLKRVK